MSTANSTLTGRILRLPASTLRSLVRINPWWLWAVNFGLVFGCALWLLLDARFEASVDWWRFENAAGASQRQIQDMGDWWWLGFRNQTVLIIVCVAAFSSMLMMVGLWFGSRRSRELKAWFIVTSIIALWITVGTNWQDIAWIGKQYRLKSVLSDFDGIIDDLRETWPDQDGELPTIGQFMAYPVSSPRTLILLTLPEFEHTSTSVAVIEGGDKVIRFELVGAEQGDWIEWHPDESSPASFLSGLGEPYEIERYQQLSGNWFLVRYRS